MPQHPSPPSHPGAGQTPRPGQQAQQAASSQSSQWGTIRFTKPLEPELFNSRAQEAAKRVAQDRNRNNRAQLRRFYDELILWETRVAQQPEKFGDYLPFIRMLNAKVAYAEGRKLVDRTFVTLMHHTLSEVTSPESLTICKLFWEAFMGFYKKERPSD
ncbi:MAG: type III-A CRISPR-associated protein Csm2 [Nitrospira sp.]|nr:type III-A CRISPR-associated protein Csm2 [Nitrospira sp.]